MNNAQFRKLLETPRSERPASSTTNNAAPATALGSKQRASIPMTPRTVSGNVDFARQLAAQKAAQQPPKKFRSSAAPLGTRLPQGYTDRAKTRDEQAIEDDRERRLAALEELMKAGQIDRDEYVKQTKLLGGDIKSTHLVRGLDFALLEKVRRGENVMDENAKKEDKKDDEDLDDVLDKALEKEVVPVERKKEKRPEPEKAPKSRAEILAELKKARQQQKEATAPTLGSKFRRIGNPRPQKAEEKVKHVVDADGRVKKKIKRSEKEAREKAVMGTVLGMVPPPPKPGTEAKKEGGDDDDMDIFAGVGTEYDPLAGLNSDEDSSDDEAPETAKPPESEPEPSEPSTMPPPPLPKMNYFNESSTTEDETYRPPTSASSLLASNPDLAAALAKASKLKPLADREEEEKEKKRRAMIEAHDRDAADIDFGFGGSRDFGDDDDDEGFVGGSGGGKKRKRGGKGKKGDKNDAGVVGRIIEERYGKGG